MTYLSRQLSSEMPLERRISIEETYSLADMARRKSNSEASRKELRRRIGHAYMLEAVENAIRNSPPASPKQSSLSPVKSTAVISWADLDTRSRETSVVETEVDEYGFEYDDGEEDLDALSLCRTASRRP